jgi:hypothetical protein
MQWQNLIPLIMSRLLLGMIIERNFDDWAILNNPFTLAWWKGEQFIELSKDNNPR